VPDEIASSPAIIRSSVVLPQPDGPTSTSSSPSPTSKLAPATPTWPFGYTLRRLSSCTRAIVPPVRMPVVRTCAKPRDPVHEYECTGSAARRAPHTLARTLALFWHVIVFIPPPPCRGA